MEKSLLDYLKVEDKAVSEVILRKSIKDVRKEHLDALVSVIKDENNANIKLYREEYEEALEDYEKAQSELLNKRLELKKAIYDLLYLLKEI